MLKFVCIGVLAFSLCSYEIWITGYMSTEIINCYWFCEEIAWSCRWFNVWRSLYYLTYDLIAYYFFFPQVVLCFLPCMIWWWLEMTCCSSEEGLYGLARDGKRRLYNMLRWNNSSQRSNLYISLQLDSSRS